LASHQREAQMRYRLKASMALKRIPHSSYRIAWRRFMEVNCAIKILLTFCAVSSLAACSSIETLSARYNYNFKILNDDKRIHYEAGSEDVAQLVKENLDKCLDKVASNEYVSFSNLSNIDVYIFNDYQRYAIFSNTKGGRAGSSENDIYISPKIKNTIGDLPNILTHELSHIHLRQYVGSWKYVYGIPAWFKEGLAVQTSNGAGAEGISKKEAIQFILEGRHFNPSEGVGIFNLKYSDDYNLSAHMFYYQAGFFVGYLKESNSLAFEKCYNGLISVEDFEDVWRKYYGKSIMELWDEFKTGLEHNHQIAPTQKPSG
jgi:hypothetical protein